MKKYGILFDYNGVIVDDEHIHERVYRKALASYGINITHEMYTKYIQGRTVLSGTRKIRSLYPQELASVTDDQLIRKKINLYKTAVAKQSILYQEVQNVLKRVDSTYKIGLVTSAMREIVEPYLKKEHIKHYFDIIVTADDVKNGKPDPEPYEKGVQLISIQPENIVVIEDTKHGVKAAKAAGLKCIAVLNTQSQVELKEADLIINNIGELSEETIGKIMRR